MSYKRRESNRIRIETKLLIDSSKKKSPIKEENPIE